MSPIGAGDGI